MYENKRIGAILLMAGAGQRFGSPKQFALLGDKPIFEHALDTFYAAQLFDEILLVCPPSQPSFGIAGGKTRQQSSYLGLKAFKVRPDIVLIHDAVRPFVSVEILKENVRQAHRTGAADTCIPSADTLVYAPGGQNIASIPKREEFLRGQTPQTFRYELIFEAHERALHDGIENATDDCQLVLRMGKPVSIVWGDERNIKITTETDLLIARQLLDQRTASANSASNVS